MNLWANSERDLQRAKYSLQLMASTVAEADRPGIHFHPPSGWMNDPNGPILDGDVYHLFYQLNPYADVWGGIHWGHACSNDLLEWSHLPVALAPNRREGLEHCFSGTCVRRSDGTWLILFTAICESRGMGVKHGAEQWGATSDGALMNWRPTNPRPVLTEAVHGRNVFEWRDPFYFQYFGRDFMLLGGNESEPSPDHEGKPCVFLYEALDSSLLDWEYKGVLFRHADARIRSVECPAIFQAGDQWVLIMSPYGPVEWYSGVFDPDSNADELFEASQNGRVDGSASHYASTVIGGDAAESILLGWVKGFPEGLGWNGVLALPRTLSLREGRVHQTLAVDLDGLVRRSFQLREESAVCGNILRIRFNTWDRQVAVALERGLDQTCMRLVAEPGHVSMDVERVNFEEPTARVTEVIIDRRMTEIFTDTGECLTLVHGLLPERMTIRVEKEPITNPVGHVDELRPIVQPAHAPK